MDSRLAKTIATKGIRLGKFLKAYQDNDTQKQEVSQKFINVWGFNMAAHFLSKYDDAESLIWALDATNLKLFIEEF